MDRLVRAIGPLVLLLLVNASCQTPPQPPAAPPTARTDPTAIPPTATTETPTQPHPEQAVHRIGVRQVDGLGEFYDIQTGEKFIPRGANYVFVPLDGSYTNLLLKVGIYDPQRTRQDFAKLADLGYNTVRVFIDHCSQGAGCIGDADNTGLNPEYLNNLADMMSAAQEAGILILFTSNDLPDRGGYAEEANSGVDVAFAGYRNSYYLRPQAITATRRYWRDLLQGLVERNAAFDAVLGWQLLNEQWMFRHQPPLSLTSGIVETTTGSYDMSDPLQKSQMVSAGMIYYIAQVKEEILLHDPTALVTMGFFAPEIAAPDWYVETASLLEEADLDFFDFHAYPGELGLQEHVEHFGMIGYEAKPILLGEYGAFCHTFSDVESAARSLMAWVAESCTYGFDGWLYWSYHPADIRASDRTWGLVDEENYLLDLFAPVNQPDPCVVTEIPTDNLAYGKPVRASQSLPGEPPENAVDENPATQWGAGGHPVQWIEVDLEGSYRIIEIRLLVSQYPAGATIHRVQVRGASGDVYQTIHELNTVTSDNDWLVFAPEQPVENISQIRIQTMLSPSWVSWKEIQVYGEESAP
jgi:hypothetical protein